MTDNIEEAIAKAIEENNAISKKSPNDILDDLKKADKDIKNKPNPKSISLGELGNFDKVNEEEIEAVFNKMDGWIFKVGKCLFRVTYLNKGQRKFTAELVNELDV